MKFPQRIDKIIPQVLKDMDIDTRMKNWVAVKKWVDIVGERIAQHAKATAVDTDRLYVEVDNPVWLNHLFLMKKTILDKIKRFDVHIKDIVFRVVDPQRQRRSDYEKGR